VGRLGGANRVVLGCVAMTETIKDHEQRCWFWWGHGRSNSIKRHTTSVTRWRRLDTFIPTTIPTPIAPPIGTLDGHSVPDTALFGRLKHPIPRVMGSDKPLPYSPKMTGLALAVSRSSLCGWRLAGSVVPPVLTRVHVLTGG
jgi:hypothetical protein